MSVSSKSTQKIREAIDTLCSAADTLDNLAMGHPPDKPAHPIAARRFDSLPEQHSEDDTLLITAADPIRLVSIPQIDEAVQRHRLEGFATFLRRFAGQRLRLVSRQGRHWLSAEASDRAEPDKLSESNSRPTPP